MYCKRLAAAVLLFGAHAGDAIAQQPCLEEVAGVCLRYAPAQDVPQTSTTLPAGAGVERLLALSRSDRKTIQRGLRRLGVYSGSIDGIFGPGTRQAIRSWQQRQKLPADGYLTSSSAKKLKEIGVRAGESSTGLTHVAFCGSGHKSGQYTVGVSRRSQEDAKRQASVEYSSWSRCPQSVVSSYPNACWAIASSYKGAWGYAAKPGLKEAKAAAKRRCEQHAQECIVRKSDCP